MQNWQDLMNYVLDTIRMADNSYKSEATPSNTYFIGLANEAFKQMGALDKITFIPKGISDLTDVIRKPNACDHIDVAVLRGAIIKESNAYQYTQEPVLSYYLSNYNMVFNREISFNTGELVLTGSGNVGGMLKDVEATSPFELINERDHAIIAFYMLWRYFASLPKTQDNILSANDWERMWREGLRNHYRNNTIARTQPFKLYDNICHDSSGSGNDNGNNATYYYNALVAYVNTAISSIDTYTKKQIDDKDKAVKDYTDEIVGEINEVLDNTNGEVF